MYDLVIHITAHKHTTTTTTYILRYNCIYWIVDKQDKYSVSYTRLAFHMIRVLQMYPHLSRERVCLLYT